MGRALLLGSLHALSCRANQRPTRGLVDPITKTTSPYLSNYIKSIKLPFFLAYQQIAAKITNILSPIYLLHCGSHENRSGSIENCPLTWTSIYGVLRHGRSSCDFIHRFVVVSWICKLSTLSSYGRDKIKQKQTKSLIYDMQINPWDLAPRTSSFIGLFLVSSLQL
mgnify:CR=1 FL=1